MPLPGQLVHHKCNVLAVGVSEAILATMRKRRLSERLLVFINWTLHVMTVCVLKQSGGPYICETVIILQMNITIMSFYVIANCVDVPYKYSSLA